MFSLFCRLTLESQGFSHPEPVKTSATSNDDVGPSMTAVLGLRRSTIRTKPIIKTIGTSQNLSMPTALTKDLEALATRAMEGLRSSLVEQDCLARIHLAQEHHSTSKDFAIGLAVSVPVSNAVRDFHTQFCHHHFPSFCPIIMPQ